MGTVVGSPAALWSDNKVTQSSTSASKGRWTMATSDRSSPLRGTFGVKIGTADLSLIGPPYKSEWYSVRLVICFYRVGHQIPEVHPIGMKSYRCLGGGHESAWNPAATAERLFALNGV
jgi:hypothetical protein